MGRRVAQLHFADGRIVVTVVQDEGAAVVRLGDRRFEKVVDDDDTLSFREIASVTSVADQPADDVWI